MTEEQIKHMVDRFLGWRLPENFNPDAGISFKGTFNEHTAHPMKHEPSGTNLFDADQAAAMVRYMVEGLPVAAAPSATISALRKALEGLLRNYDEEREVIDVSAMAGCLECTQGTTPNDRNTGPCAFHRAIAALRSVPVGEGKQDDGWIEWQAGAMPVDGNTLLRVRQRSGKEFQTKAFGLDWWHLGSAEEGNLSHACNIIAYRLSPNPTSERDAEIDEGAVSAVHTALNKQRDAALEEAAKVADLHATAIYMRTPHIASYNEAAKDIGRKIRALKQDEVKG